MIEGNTPEGNFAGNNKGCKQHCDIKILLIEDNSDIRENITEILELDGYNVLSASGGRNGVELAKEKVPYVILCDIVMPEFNGYDVLRQLKEDSNTSNILFVFV